MKSRPYLLHALTPLHAGTGQAAEIIDLPIARMRSTGIPFVPGSTVKGVLRDARRNGSAKESEELMAVFGPSVADEDPSKNAGALVVGDARLLALPVRSFRGTFAWVTSPLLLTLAKRDLSGLSTAPAKVPEVNGTGALVPDLGASVLVRRTGTSPEGKIYLEDLDLVTRADDTTAAWAKLLDPLVKPPAAPAGSFTKRFAVVDDETMTFLWETATQLDARVQLRPDTRTVKKGALWLEESLPPETLLLGLLEADKSRRKGIDRQPDAVLQLGLPEEATLQFGGKATVGRGRCRIVPLKPPAGGGQ